MKCQELVLGFKMQEQWCYLLYRRHQKRTCSFTPQADGGMLMCDIQALLSFRTFLVIQVEVLVSQLCSDLCYPMDCSPPGSSVHGISKARILKWGHFLLQGIFPIQRSNHYFLNWQVDSLAWGHLGNPLFIQMLSVKKVIEL